MQKEQLKQHIDQQNLPKHIAITMDGNGRWAKKQGYNRIFGHRNAIKAVRDCTEGCAELGVDYLTLYTFSNENWNRPKKEVSALMQLLVKTIQSETKTLQENDIRFNTIGEIEKLPNAVKDLISQTKELTKHNKRMTLTLALSYGSRSEIVEAAKKIALAAKNNEVEIENIEEKHIESFLETKDMPDPELMIRTSGENRISNFLLWQLAYAELYFTEVLWPDFRKEHLYQAIIDFQQRERRFGMTSEQVSN